MSRNLPARLVLLRSGAAAGQVRVPTTGKMRIILNVHGGQQGLANVMEGLVQRNVRALKEGTALPFSESGVKIDPKAKAWKDAPHAMADGYASNKTAAAWAVASLRAQGRQARLGFHSGIPAVYVVNSSGVPELFTLFGGAEVGYLRPTEGRSDERMILTIDDDQAMPVREVNQAIAVHNARRIREKNLPPLYKSGVKYKVEGSPELWWDAEEILRNGHDDCEGLAAYRAGELLAKGFDARVYTRLVKHPSKEMGGSGKPGGGRLFHAVTKVYTNPAGERVLAPDGTPVYDDPSKRLGMPVPDWYQKFADQMRSEGKDL